MSKIYVLIDPADGFTETILVGHGMGNLREVVKQHYADEEAWEVGSPYADADYHRRLCRDLLVMLEKYSGQEVVGRYELKECLGDHALWTMLIIDADTSEDDATIYLLARPS